MGVGYLSLQVWIHFASRLEIDSKFASQLDTLSQPACLHNPHLSAGGVDARALLEETPEILPLLEATCSQKSLPALLASDML